MTAFVLAVTILVAVLIMATLHRVAVGPTVFDRLIAAALVSANGIVLVLLIAVLFDRLQMFVDIVVAYALLAFLMPIALGKYFDRKERR